MGKIIAVLIAILMLVGCSSTSKSDYFENMKEVEILMSGTIDEIQDALELDSDIETFNSLHDLLYRLGLINNKANEISPPKKYEEAHAHYVSFILGIRDSVAAILEDNYSANSRAVDKAKSEYSLAQPLLDKIKGE